MIFSHLLSTIHHNKLHHHYSNGVHLLLLPKHISFTARQAMYVQRNNDARSPNHVCSGKTVTITYCVCCSLRNPSCNAHAPYYTVICSLYGSTIYFSTLSHKQRDFQEGRELFNIKCVFWFSLQISVWNISNSKKNWDRYSFIDTNLIHNFYINYIKLSSSTCFERHPLIFSQCC